MRHEDDQYFIERLSDIYQQLEYVAVRIDSNIRLAALESVREAIIAVTDAVQLFVSQK